MNNLLILYNPKYQSDLINAHLNVLRECGEGEIYRNDFESVRDYFLANITMPLRDNHTYALYGNNYV